ncbi:unnamed protein product [Rotaria socialis]|uniref:VPS37 C-terminal domain-containing protein n=1 Tax=Rotaria socialis TaxID=392032 RepID=A0A820YD55_9BILA|nr:unnamed protein product [Rotaria socialis]CAF3419077.1 unnamed protein product [Rotaria socialis]CAF3432539.1 unnamed protein product [Rotaria socialis]CAF3452911.1 unnamed protein product [Rotaria socialis]CAF3474638.1 unnamed protein product [Rotaria socialis]
MMNGYYNPIDKGLNEARRIVSQMGAEDLKRLMSNEDEVTKLVRNLPEIQQMETIKESLKESIKLLAMRNLEQEPMLIHEKQKLAQLHDELRQVKEKYDSIRGEYDEQTGDTSPDMIYALLKTAASDLDQSTEETAEYFFNVKRTEDEVTEFERRFIEDRKRAHELKVKADKFNELMQMSQATSYLNSNQHMRTGGYQ